MGTKLASELIADVAGLWNDIDFDRIDEEPGGDNAHNWLKFLNAGQSQLVIYRPQANVVNAVYQLVAGTKQRIPDGTSSYQNPSSTTLAEGIQLIKVIRNMGSDGLTVGNAISIIDMETLNLFFPGWHAETGAATVINYAYDERNPYNFWVTPPQPAASQGWIEAEISSVPADIADKDQVINLSDIFYHSLIDYMLFRAYLLDSDDSAMAAQKAVAHWNLFVTGIDRKDLIIKSLSPNYPPRMRSSPVT